MNWYFATLVIIIATALSTLSAPLPAGDAPPPLSLAATALSAPLPAGDTPPPVSLAEDTSSIAGSSSGVAPNLAHDGLSSSQKEINLMNAVKGRQWQYIENMDLNGVNVGGALRMAAAYDQFVSLKNMILQGNYHLNDVIVAKQVLRPTSNSLPFVEEVISTLLTNYLEQTNVEAILQLVNQKAVTRESVIEAAYSQKNYRVYSLFAEKGDVSELLDTLIRNVPPQLNFIHDLYLKDVPVGNAVRYFAEKKLVNEMDYLLQNGAFKAEDVCEAAQVLLPSQSTVLNNLLRNKKVLAHIIKTNRKNLLLGLVKENKIDVNQARELAVQFNNGFMLSSLQTPKDNYEKLMDYIRRDQWQNIKKMNLQGIDVSEAIKLAAERKQDDALRYMLAEGKFAMQSVLDAKASLKGVFNSHLESAIDKLLIQQMNSDQSFGMLDSLVQQKSVSLERVIKLARENSFEQVLRHFNVPTEAPLPRISLTGHFVPVDYGKEEQAFNPSNYPELELKQVKYRAVKLLGSGADGQTVQYQNPDSTDQNLAVKIGLQKDPNFKIQRPLLEETHLTRKLQLLEGKSATFEGYTFTPMTLIKGSTYHDILRNPDYQRPDQVLNQFLAIEKALKAFEVKGLEHGDLHLQNLMYDPITKKATIIDLGRGASTTISNDPQSFNVNAYGDRFRLWTDISQRIKYLQRSQKTFDYSRIMELLEKHKLRASSSSSDSTRMKVQVPPSMSTGTIATADLVNLFLLNESKMAQISNSIDEFRKKNQMTEEDWKNVKELAKYGKILSRKQHVLASGIHLHQHGQFGNQLLLNEVNYYQKLVQSGRGLDANTLQHYQNILRQQHDIQDLNHFHNSRLNMYHSIFQEAKAKLAGTFKK